MLRRLSLIQIGMDLENVNYEVFFLILATFLNPTSGSRLHKGGNQKNKKNSIQSMVVSKNERFVISFIKDAPFVWTTLNLWRKSDN
jgi:hypothetical protein